MCCPFYRVCGSYCRTPSSLPRDMTTCGCYAVPSISSRICPEVSLEFSSHELGIEIGGGLLP